MTNLPAGTSMTHDRGIMPKDAKERQYTCVCTCLCDEPVTVKGTCCGSCAKGNHKE